uniref:Geranylgeranyl transferase type-2 subunit alpha n=1 Tax=Rhabditophanes sp. KR3021 TaxID=114890 RepID=A0AC35U0U7_9BILA
MHFVKKVPTTEEQQLENAKKKETKKKVYEVQMTIITAKYGAQQFDDEFLELIGKILVMLPDDYTLWSHRREYYLFHFEQFDKKNERDSKLGDELELTKVCLQGNPKSYSAWFHRLWAIKNMKSPDFKKELALTEKALKADCRNFHVWDYRRDIVNLDKTPTMEELEFSNRMIDANISNYSAWHYRITILEIFHLKTAWEIPYDVLAEEFEKIANAFYTEAEDQSCWYYASFLIDVTENHVDSQTKNLLRNLMSQCDELFELEPNNIGPLEIKTKCMKALGEKKEEIYKNYLKLASIDPGKSTKYLDQGKNFA